jgi:RNA polymerase sigma-70 factor, ECF subfamily
MFPFKATSCSKDEFRALIVENQEMVYRVCFGVLRNQFEAEETTQDVFVQAWKSMNDFRKEAKISTWLYRIALNKSLNVLRTRKKTLMVNIEEAYSVHSVDHVDHSMDREHHRVMLREAFSKVPKKQLKAFILTKYEGLSMDEAAKILDCSRNSVEVNVHRARIRLREILSERYNIKNI